jgi:sortase (surface protein transpeptidase)
MAIFRRRLVLDALTALLAAGGVVLVVIGGNVPAQHPRRAAAVESPQGPPAPIRAPASNQPVRAHAGPAPLGRSEPVHVDIPAIGVSTPLMALGLNPDGTIAVPPLSRGAPAGWYRYLVTPGEVGPAVILGHVDTARDGPAVFYRLQELRPGDTVAVRRTDGRTAIFTVNRVAQYPKLAFPADEVYGAVDHPALRLITCGGSFDPIHRQYRGNVVVYAELTG